MDVPAILNRTFRLLESLGLQYAVGGSFASGVWGIPRPTGDLDIVIALQTSDAEPLVAGFEPEFMILHGELQEALQSREIYRCFQILHVDGFFKIDCFLLGADDYSKESFKRNAVVEILPGVIAPCASPEDTVLRKLLWYQLGNCVSDKQWNDIVQVVEIQGESLDRDYLTKWALQLGIADLLTRALADGDGE